MAISEVTVKNSTQMAIDEINAAGGVMGKQLTVVAEDGASEPTIFAEKAQKLVRSDCAAASGATGLKYTDEPSSPAATMARPSDASRLGLKHPPMQRLSFFAELLPFLGRGNLSSTIVTTESWYDPANVPAAEWV